MTDHDSNDFQAERLTGFAQRLRDRFGKAVDPHVSLEPSPPASPPSSPGGHNEAQNSSTIPGDLHKTRLERLGTLTPAEFRYQFREEVGRGGMGAVLKVWDRDLRRHLAMKVVTAKGTATDGDVPTDHSKLTRFLEEAQITGQLDHPGVVPVHELGMDARGRCFFTMRLVKGKDLKAVFGAIHSEELVEDSDLTGWNRNRALTAVHRVCETMAFAHSKGVVHRDLKPANIMVGRFGETYVMDWGLAKVQGREETRDLRLRTDDHSSVSFVRTDRMQEADADPDSPLITMDGDVVGTPAYMAPEQARGELEKVGSQADIYSMGAILYHLLSGRAPYSEPEQRVGPHVVLMKVLGGPPVGIHTLRKDVPVELAAICEKAMAYSRRQRYETMMELADDLSAFLEGRVVTAYEKGSIAEFKKWVTRNRSFAAVVTAAILILLLTLGRISFLKTAANEILGKKNAELIAATLKAESNEDLATSALIDAEASARTSIRRSYISEIQAATLSLRIDDPRSAIEHLKLADGAYAGWEWLQLDLARDTSLETWQTEVDQEQCVAYSRNGEWIASVANRARHGIDLRNSASGELLEPLSGHNGPITAMAFSPDSSLLASTSTDQSVRIWEVATGRSIVIANVGQTEDICFSPLRSQIAVAVHASSERPGQIKVFEFAPNLDTTPSEIPQSTYDCQGGNATAVIFGPRGKRLITGTDTGLIQLWDLATHTVVTRLDSALSAVTSVAISSSGSQFAVTTEDGVLRVAKTDNGSILARRSLGVASANDCEFLEDGRLVLACSDSILRVFNAESLALTSVFGHGEELTAVAISGQGQNMVTASKDGVIKHWSCFSFLPTELFSGQTKSVLSVAFDPSGRALAAAYESGQIWVWDAASGKVRHVLEGHRSAVQSLAFSHNGTWIASGSTDKSVRLWNAASGNMFTIWNGHAGWVSEVAFSPDDRYLATASTDRTIRIWDIEKEKCVSVLKGHKAGVQCLAWNPTGTRVFAGDRNGTVIEWAPFRAEPMHTYKISEQSLTDLTFVPGQNTFVVSSLDSNLSVMEIQGERLFLLGKHRKGIAAITLSPDGSRLISGGMDGSLFVWDTSDWNMLTDLHTGEVNLRKLTQRQIHAMAFSPDGKRLATSQGDQVRTWESTGGHERHRAKVAAQSMVSMLDTLFDDYGIPSDVIESLRSNTDISGKLREAAIQLTQAASKDSGLLDEQLWRMLLGNDSSAYPGAFNLALKLFEEEPTNPDYRGAMAVAQYRTGQYQQATDALGELLASLGQSKSELRPVFQIFRAMGHFQVGQIELARRDLDTMREAMLRPAWQRLAGPLFSEADALIPSGD